MHPNLGRTPHRHPATPPEAHSTRVRAITAVSTHPDKRVGIEKLLPEGRQLTVQVSATQTKQFSEQRMIGGKIAFLSKADAKKWDRLPEGGKMHSLQYHYHDSAKMSQEARSHSSSTLDQIVNKVKSLLGG